MENDYDTMRTVIFIIKEIEIEKPIFRFSCAVLLCCCLTGCGSIQHKSSTDTAQAQGTKAPPKTADDFSISSDSENETVDETSSADAATPSASESESVTQQKLLTGAAALTAMDRRSALTLPGSTQTFLQSILEQLLFILQILTARISSLA